MRTIETILPPQHWTLHQVLDLAELMLAFLAHPERRNSRVGYLKPGRLSVTRNTDGRPTQIEMNGDPCSGNPPPQTRFAPELAAGQQPTFQSDLYLMGLVLYECLTGRPLPAFLSKHDPQLELRPLPGLQQLLRATLDIKRRQAARREALLEVIHIARVENSVRMQSLEVGQRSVLGPGRDRLRNQDALGAFVHQGIAGSEPATIALLVISDGIGSTVSGGRVATIMVQHAALAFHRHAMSNPLGTLYEHCALFCRRIFAEAMQETLEACRNNESLGRGGATCTMALIVDGRLGLAHLGDSRAVLIEPNGGHTTLTRDHTWAGAAYDVGHVDRDTMRTAWGDLLMRYVGDTTDTIHQDSVEDLSAALPGQHHIDLRPGQQVLLMSDGVCGPLPPSTLSEIVTEAATAQQSANDLIRAVFEHRGSDNTSVLVARPHFNEPTPLPAVGPVGRLER